MLEFLSGWHPTIYHFLYGALGGLIANLAQSSGVLIFPQLVKKSNKHGVDLGFLSPSIVGGFVGFVVDHHIMLAGLGGYIGIKVLDGVITKFFPSTTKGDKDETENQTERHP